MSSDSDSDFIQPASDEGEDDDDCGDLSDLGAASTTVKIDGFKRTWSQVNPTEIERLLHGFPKIARLAEIQQSQEADDLDSENNSISTETDRVAEVRHSLSNQQHVPTPREQTLEQTCDKSVGSSTVVFQQNVYKIQHKLENVTIQGPKNLSIGGTQNVSRQGPSQGEQGKTPALLEELLNETLRKVKLWIEGMVMTSALEKVLQMLNKESKWITIKGSPGEGKTTVAYMALEKLHSKGRHIFHVTSPEQFSQVIKSEIPSAVMLDDIFGNLEFDQMKWRTWENCLHEVLDLWEHRSPGPVKTNTIILFVGRDYVLKPVLIDMGRINKFFTEATYVVDMSKSYHRTDKEKHSVWKAISDPRGVQLDEKSLEDICKTRVPHGFPHVCRLFVTHKLENSKISAREFFAAPLQFLNETIVKFTRNKEKLFLLKEMAKGDGKVSVEELRKLDSGSETIQTAYDLVGTYLRREDDYFVFDHPSVYDSVAYNLCHLFPQFVIENCNLTFIKERVRLKSASESSDSIAYIDKFNTQFLAKRFAKEIEKRNLLHVLSHEAFTDESFLEGVLSNWKQEHRKLYLNMRDRSGGTVIQYLCEFGHLACVNLAIRYGANTNVKDGIGMSPMFYACMENQADVVKLLLNRGVQADADAVVKACEKGNLNLVKSFFEDETEVERRTFHGDTPLHGACRGGHTSVVTFLLEQDFSVNVSGVLGRSPLFEACAYNQPEVVQILLKHEADASQKDLFGNTPRITKEYDGLLHPSQD